MENTKMPQKTSITQQLQTELGRSVGMVWLKRLTGTQLSNSLQQPCNEKDTHFKNV